MSSSSGRLDVWKSRRNMNNHLENNSASDQNKAKENSPFELHHSVSSIYAHRMCWGWIYILPQDPLDNKLGSFYYEALAYSFIFV